MSRMLQIYQSLQNIHTLCVKWRHIISWNNFDRDWNPLVDSISIQTKDNSLWIEYLVHVEDGPLEDLSGFDKYILKMVFESVN